ncbi:hypothetical protein Bca4012_079109 [Brassica carinata]
MAIYVASGQLSRGIAAATLRYATAMGIWDLIPCRLGKRGTPSGRSKFVPINAETLQNFEVGGDRERMPEPIVSAFDVL